MIIDRGTAARLGLTVRQIDNTLYDAFGQRQVSTIYAAQNQYHVIMEVAPEFWQTPETLKQIYVSTSGRASGTQATQPLVGTVFAKDRPGVAVARAGLTRQLTGESARDLANNAIANTRHGATSTGAAISSSPETLVPLSAVAHFDTSNTPLSVNQEGLFVVATISFNLAPGISHSQATAAIDDKMRELDMSASIHAGFQVSAIARQRTVSDRRCAARRLYRARCSL